MARIWFSPLVNKISGPYARDYVIRTRKDRSIVIARKATSMGAEQDHPSIQYSQASWNALDAYWHTLDHADKVEWAKCPPYNWTGFVHYKQLNMVRHHCNYCTIPRPPDKFHSHRIYKPLTLPSGDIRLVHVWRDGLMKPGGEFTPDTPGPPAPPDNPCIVPPGPGLCPTDCRDCNRYMFTFFYVWEGGEVGPVPGECDCYWWPDRPAPDPPAGVNCFWLGCSYLPFYDDDGYYESYIEQVTCESVTISECPLIVADCWLLWVHTMYFHWPTGGGWIADADYILEPFDPCPLGVYTFLMSSGHYINWPFTLELRPTTGCRDPRM